MTFDQCYAAKNKNKIQNQISESDMLLQFVQLT